MSRLIALMDAKRRDAQVNLEAPKGAARVKYLGIDGQPVVSERLIKGLDSTSYEALLRRFGNPAALGDALVAGDPEIALEQVGRRLGEATRVYLRADGSMLYAAHTLQVVYAADGTEKSRQDFVDVEATVNDAAPAVWSGKMMPINEVVRKFAFVRKLQVRHVNGLTYDFLHEMAKTLDEAGTLVYVGAGPKGGSPLIFNVNGTPYRGFLEGKVDGPRYRLVLHLSNLEIKRPQVASQES